MQHLDEGTIHAWLDGELPLEDRQAVEAHIASCGECKAAVAEARGFIAASTRILTALDAVPGGVLPATSVPLDKQRAAPTRFSFPRAMRSRAWMAAAAVLVLSTVTVIAVRPGEKPAALRVAEVREESKPTAPSPSVMQSLADSGTVRGAPPPPAPAEKQLANAPAPRPAAAPMRIADAARARKAESPSPAPAQAAPEVPNASASGDPGGAPIGRLDVRAHDSALAGETARDGISVGSAESNSAKLGVAMGSASEKPQILSRVTTNEGGDTVVTTVYSIRDVPVSLIDRSSQRAEPRRAARAPAAAQSMAKSRESADNAQAVNSLTWSDSTGHTRTLRGALPLGDLQNVKRALFGATP